MSTNSKVRTLSLMVGQEWVATILCVVVLPFLTSSVVASDLTTLHSPYADGFEALRSRLRKPGYQEFVTTREALFQIDEHHSTSMGKTICSEFNRNAEQWLRSMGNSDTQSLYLAIELRDYINPQRMSYLYARTDIRHLTIQGNGISDEHLAYVSQLPSVEILEVHGTRSVGKFLRSVELPALRFLHVANSPVDDTSVKDARFPKGLRLLDLTGTRVTNDAIEFFPAQLEVCWIANTAVDSEGLARLMDTCPQLAELIVDYDDLDRDVVQRIRKIATMRSVTIRVSSAIAKEIAIDKVRRDLGPKIRVKIRSRNDTTM